MQIFAAYFRESILRRHVVGWCQLAYVSYDFFHSHKILNNLYKLKFHFWNDDDLFKDSISDKYIFRSLLIK